MVIMLMTFSCMHCLNVLELENSKQLKQSCKYTCTRTRTRTRTRARAHTHTHTHTHTHKHIAYTCNVQHVHCSFFIGGVMVAGTAAFLDGDSFKMLRLHVFLASEIGFSVFNVRMHFLMPIFIEDT